jgi:hypothetical protein
MLAGQQGGTHGGGGGGADGTGQLGEPVPDDRGAEHSPGPGDRQRPEAAQDGFGQAGQVPGGGLDDTAELPGEAVGEQRVHRRARRADGDRAVLEQDNAGSAAADVDAEDPPGPGAVPRDSGGARLAHLFTIGAAGIHVA